MKPVKMIEKRPIPHEQLRIIMLFLRVRYGIAGFVRRVTFDKHTEKYQYWIEFIYQ